MDTQQNHRVAHGYPYDPRTHTFLSPAGMTYPAPNPYRPPSPSLGEPLSIQGVYQHGSQSFGHNPMMKQGAWNGIESSSVGVPAPGQGQYPILGHGPGHPSLPARPPASLPSQLTSSPHTSRSSILDTPTRTPSAGPYLSAPPHQPSQRSPSAPLDPRRDKRKASPGLTGPGQTENSGRRIVSDLPGRARKIGGPPKAILGGIGGKTFDEMQLVKATSAANLPPKPSTLVLDPEKPASPAKEKDSNSNTKWKGSLVAIKLPPNHYSPPDTPTTDKPIAQHPPPLIVEEDTPKKPRKDAYPWPKHRKVLSGSSNSETRRKHAGNVGTVRRSKAPISSGEFAEPSWRGKEVLVGLPSQDAWGSLFARAEEVKRRKEMAEQDAREDDVEDSTAKPFPGDVDNVALESPIRDQGDSDGHSNDHTPEVISKGRVGNTAFLKRSLGGIIRDGTIKDSSSRSQRRAISDVFSVQDDAAPTDNSTIDDDAESTPERTREGAPSPEFVEIPLSAINTDSEDPLHVDKADRSSKDTDQTPRITKELGISDTDLEQTSPLSELGDLRTITPAKSRRFGTFVQRGFEDTTVDAIKTDGSDVDSPTPDSSDPNPSMVQSEVLTQAKALMPDNTDPQASSATRALRAEAGSFRPTSSRTMSTSSISSSVLGLTTQSTKLRPGVANFVPGHRPVSSMSVASDTDSANSASAAKGALRASAAAFQPRNASEQLSRSSSVSGHPVIGEDISATSAVSTPSPQKRVVSLRAEAVAWQPTSRTASISSSTASRPLFTDTEGDHSFETSETGTVSPVKHSMPTSPTKLHATAKPFVPILTGIRSVSSPAQSRLPDRTSPDTLDEADSDRVEREESGKRARLRPSATAFVPARSVSATITRRQGLAAQAHLVNKEDDGKRLVPDTFEFAPALRPTAEAFVPRFEHITSGHDTVPSEDPSPGIPPDQPSTPNRGRAETVAFSTVPLQSTPHTAGENAALERGSDGPDSPAALLHNLRGYAAHEDVADDQASNEEDVRESADLSGLFYRPRQDTVSTQAVEDVPAVWRGEASPRDPIDSSWQEAVNDHTVGVIRENSIADPCDDLNTDSQQVEIEPRLNRMERSNSTRSNENSHLPLAMAARPRSAVDFAVSEIPIHPSHPFNTPLVSARNADSMPDVPRSAHTQHASGSNGFPSPGDPIPPLPVFARAQKTPPVSTLPGMFNKPPLSALPGGISDPFAPSPPLASAHTGDSPASRYSQSSARTPNKYTQSPIKLSQTPHQRRRTSVATTAGNETFTTADGSPLLPSRSVFKPMSDIPGPKSEGSNETSTAHPADSINPATSASETPSIKVAVAKEKRFREWIFPLHGPRPSMSRRHTIPTELSPEILRDDAGPGIASTSFADLVGDLRTAKPTHRALSSALSDPGQIDIGNFLDAPPIGREREASVEFPMRSEIRSLKVINEVSSRSSSMVQDPTGAPAVDFSGESMRNILERLESLIESGLSVDPHRPEKRDGHADTMSALSSQLSASLKILQSQSAILTDHQSSHRELAERSISATDAAPDHDQRSEEMFQAMLTGQHAMLDKLAELSEGRIETWQAMESIRLTNAQMYDQLAQSTAAQDRLSSVTTELDGLRASVAQLTEAAAEARSEAGIYKSRLDDARKDRDALRDELDSKAKRMQSLESKVKDQESENDKQLAMRLAAELERDTLSKSLLDTRDEFDKLVVELESSQAESTRLKEDRDSLRTELRAREEARDESRRSDIAQLRDVTATLQESLLVKISGLEAGMIDATTASSSERTHLVEENKRLQDEVRGLRQRADAFSETNAALQVSLSDVSTKAEMEQINLQKQLAIEQERRDTSENRVTELDRQLEQVRREMIDARTIATERQAYARMSEVRLQTLTQEAVYWRQFALEADRRRYKTYMATKPFQGSPPDAQLQTPLDIVTGRREHDLDPKTPTQNGAREAHPLSHSIVAYSPDEEGTESKKEGQWWGLAA